MPVYFELVKRTLLVMIELMMAFEEKEHSFVGVGVGGGVPTFLNISFA